MKKNIFLFCFLLSASIALAGKPGVLTVSKLNDSIKEIALDKYWKFHNGDDSAWAVPSFDDSHWDTVKTNLKFNENDSNIFKGIGWFRVHIFIDPSLNNTPLCLRIEQDGASQIFLDGKLIHSLGTVSADINKEKKYDPRGIPLSFRYGNAGEYLLAVRYSNLNYRKLFKKYQTDYPGFTISIAKQDDSVLNDFDQKINSVSITIMLAIFFLTLSFVHLLFFLFYRKRYTNLFYSIFVFIFGLLFITPTISNNISNPELSIILNYYILFILPLFFYALLLLHYSLFRRPFGKYFWFLTAFLLATIIVMLFKINNFSLGFLFSFIISTVVPSFFIVIKSIRRKLDGAWIIGTGSLLFLILLGIIIIKIMIFGSTFYVHSLLPIVLIFIALVSIPVSMSIYLAREFAQTNKHLEQNLMEVKTLSAKSVEQEKEKQNILETQKEILEIQVTERTAEITEQKKVIEEKNKDIIDSIDYAKTIQEAILPSKEHQHKLFPDSFILFKPKDIVSGDFYWFAEKDGKKLIAACDCTGHGVPGALMSMVGNNILNQVVNEKGITAPDEILNHLHKEIRNTLKQGEQSETKDGMDIAFCALELPSPNGEGQGVRLTFAGAQRPIWIIRSEELTEIKGNKFAIGGLQSETERTFTSHKISLTKGDNIYIFSDGFADQFSDKDKKLMTSRFKEVLISIQHKSMQEQETYLDKFIDDWKGNREQIDDILVIGVRV